MWVRRVGELNKRIAGEFRSRNLDAAVSLFAEVNEVGVPTPHTLTLMINGMKSSGVAAAQHYFDMRTEIGLAPNAYLYQAMIQVHCQYNQVKEAKDLLREMRECKLHPQASTYNDILKAMIATNRSEEALQLLGEMRRNKIEASPNTYKLMLRLMVRIRRFDDVLVLLEKMRKLGLAIPDDFYGQLVGNYVSHGRVKEACDILRLLKQPHRVSWSVLNHFTVAAGRSAMLLYAMTGFRLILHKSKEDFHTNLSPIELLDNPQSTHEQLFESQSSQHKDHDFDNTEFQSGDAFREIVVGFLGSQGLHASSYTRFLSTINSIDDCGLPAEDLEVFNFNCDLSANCFSSTLIHRKMAAVYFHFPDTQSDKAFNALLCALLMARELLPAFRLYSKMRNYRVRLSNDTFRLVVLSSCIHGSVNNALETYETFLNTVGEQDDEFLEMLATGAVVYGSPAAPDLIDYAKDSYISSSLLKHLRPNSVN